ARVAGPFLGNAAIPNAHDPVGDAGRLGVMADDHGGAAMLAHEVRHHVVHLLGRRGVELARRFVGEEDLRAMRQRSTERDTLLLASGELSRAAVALRAEPDAVEELVRPPTALRARQAVQPELDGDEL